MAFVRKRGATWYACWVDDVGAQRQMATSAQTKRECQRLAEDLERKAERVRLGLDEAVPDPVQLCEVAQKYLALVTAKQRSHKSTEGRIRLHILPTLGDKFVHQIRPVDIEELLANLEVKGYSAAQRRHVRTHLGAMLDFARDRMKVLHKENPVDAVPQVELPEREIFVLTLEQRDRLLAAAGDWRFLLMFAALTGLRKGELCGLRWEDIDVGARLVTVKKSYDGPTKNKKTRYVPIHTALIAELELRRREATTTLVFPRENGGMRTRNWKPQKMLRAALKRAELVLGYRATCRRKKCRYTAEQLAPTKGVGDCPKCGFALWPVAVPIPATLKHLRSTYGTLAYEATGDLRFAQDTLGHKDEETTTAHYAKQRALHLVRQVDRLQVPASSLPSD